jgi:hypothetical protein
MSTPPSFEPQLPPFFILGCVRSGTTMLRDLLRRHPNLACPEETHLYRWGEPFGSPGFLVQTHGALLKAHRTRDGIPDDEFRAMIGASTSRAELMKRYMARYLAVAKPGARRWFDKTPQNVYGAMLLAADFPQARFVHIVRNPVEVVASLRIGKVIAIADLRAACAYWNEAVTLINALRVVAPGRVLELRYEDFTSRQTDMLPGLLSFVGEKYHAADFAGFATETVTHRWEQVLTVEDVAMVEFLCAAGREQHGYVRGGAPVAVGSAAALSDAERPKGRLKRWLG